MSCNDLARKSEGVPQVSTRFSLSMENEQADGDGTGETKFSGTNSQKREIIVFLDQLTTSSIGSHNIAVDAQSSICDE